MENIENTVNKVTETLIKELEGLSEEGLHEFFIFFYRMNHQHGNMIAMDKFEEFLETFDSNPFRVNEDKKFRKQLIENSLLLPSIRNSALYLYCCQGWSGCCRLLQGALSLKEDEMYILKKLGVAVLFLLLLSLLIAPVGMLYLISKEEQKQYLSKPVPIVEELAYGEIVPVGRMDMNETVTLSGKITGTKEFFMELPCKDSYALRFMVEQGEVIHSGDLLAYEGKKEIISTANGLIREICLGTNSYLRLVSLEDLALECEITDKQASVFRRNYLSLSDEDGQMLQVLELSETYSASGTLKLLLKYDTESIIYGQPVDNLTLYTGKTYFQALVVEKRCIYQKTDSGKYYVRLVDENGHFLQEAEVTLGYSNEDYVCISGVEEGVLCDAGYGSLWGNRSNGST